MNDSSVGTWPAHCNGRAARQVDLGSSYSQGVRRPRSSQTLATGTRFTTMSLWWLPTATRRRVI